ncbi:17215_t:CDS:1, partial [Dentiscutata erythropus]
AREVLDTIKVIDAGEVFGTTVIESERMGYTDIYWSTNLARCVFPMEILECILENFIWRLIDMENNPR